MKPSLIIPVESQVRELDPKLLLAAVAVNRGYPCHIGSRLEIDFRITAFPRSIYLSKSMTARSIKMFRIMRKLGHEIAVWDEEALVHMEPEVYFGRRLSTEAIRHVSHLFAWGRENLELWEQYPELPKGIPIHTTGNPRGDMLRPELRDYFREDADKLRKAHGDFILVNTNFSGVNAYVPSLNLFHPQASPDEPLRYARSAVGMGRGYAEGLHRFKKAVFEDFLRLIPELESAFPDQAIIVRPHPIEKMEAYHAIAAMHPRVKVINEGNVIPWLLATKALVHNSCTTAIEAYLLDVPAVSYMASRDEHYDDTYYRFPNRISHRCSSLEELKSTLSQILSGKTGPASDAEKEELIGYYLEATNGSLACERIIDALEPITGDWENRPEAPLGERFEGCCRANWRRSVKWCKSFLPDSKYRPEFQRHRYPGLTLEEVERRLSRIKGLLKIEEPMVVSHTSEHVFRIASAR